MSSKFKKKEVQILLRVTSDMHDLFKRVCESEYITIQEDLRNYIRKRISEKDLKRSDD